MRPVTDYIIRKADEAKVEQFIRNTAILMEGIPVTPLA